MAFFGGEDQFCDPRSPSQLKQSCLGPVAWYSPHQCGLKRAEPRDPLLEVRQVDAPRTNGGVSFQPEKVAFAPLLRNIFCPTHVVPNVNLG